MRAQKNAERVLVGLIVLYWVFFSCTLVRVLLTLYDVCFRKTTKWTHAKTIHATIAAALLARAVHLTLLHFDDEGKYLFISAQDEDMLFKVLASIPPHILITIYSLLGLLWLSFLTKTYDLSAALIPKTFSLFGKKYDQNTTQSLKHHLTLFCIAFNIFLYVSWAVFLICMYHLPNPDKIYSIQEIFTSTLAIMLAMIYMICWHRISRSYQQNNNILSVEKHHLVKRILWLVIICTAVFMIKFPIVVYVSVKDATWLTSFAALITFTVLEIFPFLVILFLTSGKKVEEFRNESSRFSFSFRRYSTI